MGWKITGQTYTSAPGPGGGYEPVVEVAFETDSTPPVKGVVSVPQSLLRDRVAFVEAVKSQISEATAAHEAVSGLTST